MEAGRNLQGRTLGVCPPLNKVLVVAPHPDDEVLGCGGTIAKHSADGDEVYVCVVTKGCSPLFSEELVSRGRRECREADKVLGVKETVMWEFPAAMVEDVPRHELNGSFIELFQSVKPDIVYIPHRGDMQLDHKLTADACMVALRPKYGHLVRQVYAYETLSETGWDIPNMVNEFIPTMYNDISGFIGKKLDAMGKFQSQLSEFPAARSLHAVRALAEYRGAMVGVRAAEAFSVIREVNL